MKNRRKPDHLYLVGWTGSTKYGATVYGRNDSQQLQWVNLLTLKQARGKMKKLGNAWGKSKRAVFKIKLHTTENQPNTKKERIRE